MTHPWISGGVDFLESAYDPERGLFSYSSKLVGDTISNDFKHSAVIRYSINSLLGLQEAARWEHSMAHAYSEKLERFLERQLDSVEGLADRGLLLVLLIREGRLDQASDVLDAIRTFVQAPDLSDIDLQSVSWMLWGSTSAAQAGLPGAAMVSKKLFRILQSHYFHRNSLLARHSLERYRRDLVSFGGTVYYLRALYEYGVLHNDEYALATFDWAVRRVMSLQGPQGEWPWMISVRRAAIVDPYPVFSVHQDSMAMLFLIPALERRIPGVERSIANSCLWVEGRNELAVNLVNQDPFFVSRSIQRSESAPRLRRYLRSIAGPKDSWPAAGERKVEVNPECRSYHIGWILFVWSGRVDLLESSLTTNKSL